MPQDRYVQCFDSAGNAISCDSLPENVQSVTDSIIHAMEVQPYIDAKEHKDDTFMPFVFLFFFIFLVIVAVKNARRQEAEDEAEAVRENDYVPDDNKVKYLVYYGSELEFSDNELIPVLNKYFPYYTKIGETGKEKFLHRLKRFISEKIFVIHDESGFKEMPILISASAVQISFGLDKYLLPYFSHIHIFPEEFIGYHPTLRVLEGNVSGHSVNLSWKHFLNGYQFPENGQNVGLHEFAHAFYYQYFETGENVERDFVARFPLFDACGNKAFEQEQKPGNDLYSDYALKNFQEFWAESVEVFFEKPVMLRTSYPDLFEAMTEILKQDPSSHNIA
ncbi:MAG: zinc-dependent peptidase [Bacteroidota bacterium]